MFGNIFNKDVAPNKKNTLMAIACYVVLAMILSVFGIAKVMIAEEAGGLIDIILYYLLLWCPAGAAALVHRISPNTKAAIDSMYALFLVYFSYVLFSGEHFLMGLSVIPMIISAVLFAEGGAGIVFNWAAVIIDALYIIFFYLKGDEAQYSLDKIAVFIAIAVSSATVKVIFDAIENRQKLRLDELNVSRDRFRAIVSVGIAQIFEYDITKDLLMTAKSEDGTYGKESYICNVSSVAKQYRYILFTDWYRFDELINECKSGAGMVEKELRIKKSTGDYRWFRVRGRVMFDEAGMPNKVIGSLEDIDDAKRLELRQADQNMRDPLTKLYRRPYVNQMIQEYIAGQSGENYCGLLILDIDEFEQINEQMGNAFGDEILKNVAEDIDELFYATDIMGRIGGDEFIILMKNIKSVGDIESKIREIQHIIATTYVGEKNKLSGTVGIGGAVYPIHGTDYDTLYRNAQKALMHAQEKGHNHYEMYDPDVDYGKYDIISTEGADKESENASRSAAGDSLIELAFKLIDESKDTDSAINLLIRQVARQMDLSSIAIMETAENENDQTLVYYYGSEDSSIEEVGGKVSFDEEQWMQIKQEYQNTNGLILADDVANMANPVIRQISLARGLRSFAACAFYDKGVLQGNILFMDSQKEHRWTADECASIRAVTNVVASYLLKMKAYEDASDTVERLTGYDMVTGLYKYEKFLSLVGEYLENAPHGNYAIAYMDFSNFKYINETYGYETGDKVLKDMADTILGYKDVVIYASRVFSDNLVALLQVKDYDEAGLKRDIESAEKKFTSKIQKEYLDSRLVIDVGVCTFTVSGQAIPLMNIISNANLARKQTKLPDMPRTIFYDNQMGMQMMSEVAFANDMENAFRNREFVVYMQPKVNLENGRIEGSEALIRWRKDDGSIIFPNDFIPVFEKNKSITLLDYYVYDEVCKYLRKRLDEGLEMIRVSMNVSRVHLYSIDDIIGYIRGLLTKYEIPPHYLEFELTETAFTDKVDDTITLMNRLRELGVLVSMDDFGSGYSSLNVLTKLPLDVLKLDKEFLKDFGTDTEGMIIIPSVVEMAKKLKLAVVCEGVETLEQVNFLREIGCDYAQGYYYSKPIPQSDFDELMVKMNGN